MKHIQDQFFNSSEMVYSIKGVLISKNVTTTMMPCEIQYFQSYFPIAAIPKCSGIKIHSFCN